MTDAPKTTAALLAVGRWVERHNAEVASSGQPWFNCGICGTKTRYASDLRHQSLVCEGCGAGMTVETLDDR